LDTELYDFTLGHSAFQKLPLSLIEQFSTTPIISDYSMTCKRANITFFVVGQSMGNKVFTPVPLYQSYLDDLGEPQFVMEIILLEYLMFLLVIAKKQIRFWKELNLSPSIML
jgi:hypothetical protein